LKRLPLQGWHHDALARRNGHHYRTHCIEHLPLRRPPSVASSWALRQPSSRWSTVARFRKDRRHARIVPAAPPQA